MNVMGIVTTIFYVLCACWLVALVVVVIVKKIKQRKETKKVIDEVSSLDGKQEENK